MTLKFKQICLYAVPLGLLAYATFGAFNSLNAMRGELDESYALSSRDHKGQRLEMEYRRFQMHLHYYVERREETSFDDVMRSFDVLWSRVQVILEGSRYAPLRTYFENGALLQGLWNALHDVDAILKNIKPGDIDKMEQITRILSKYDSGLVNSSNRLLFARVKKTGKLDVSMREMISSMDKVHREFLLGTGLFILLLIIETYKARKAEKRARARSEHARYLAEHDSLTGLGNRTHFNSHITEHIREADQEKSMFYLLLLDLNGFKDINDNFSHRVGDQLLKAVSQRLKRSVRPSDIVTRIGGDEFGIITKGSEENARTLAQRLIDKIGQPYMIKNRSILVSSSVGLSAYPKNGTSGSRLLRDANLALYDAKNADRNSYRLFSNEMEQALNWRKRLEGYLPEALANNALDVHYQPQVDLKTGQVVGVEALARWFHPELGNIPPSDFIAAAERAGLISSLGEWVLRRACEDFKTWHEAGFKLRVSVNLSPHQLERTMLADEILSILQECDMSCEHLTLELTETSMMQNSVRTQETLTKLHNAGIRFAVDDFGTGYSNLGYLPKYPVSYLKIDRSFIRNLENSDSDRLMVSGIINLARGLGLDVIAEGVETPAQVACLRQMKCSQGQGYLYGKPMSNLNMMLLLAKSGNNHQEYSLSPKIRVLSPK